MWVRSISMSLWTTIKGDERSCSSPCLVSTVAFPVNKPQLSQMCANPVQQRLGIRLSIGNGDKHVGEFPFPQFQTVPIPFQQMLHHYGYNTFISINKSLVDGKTLAKPRDLFKDSWIKVLSLEGLEWGRNGSLKARAVTNPIHATTHFNHFCVDENDVLSVDPYHPSLQCNYSIYHVQIQETFCCFVSERCSFPFSLVYSVFI